MTHHLRHFLKGVGSVMDLAPQAHAERFIPRDSDADRLRGDLERIGADMRQVLETDRHDRHPDRTAR